jgi:glycosyltransferase involved in cell wall biosynthesis
MSPMKFSIAVPNFNGQPYFQDALESLINAGRNRSVEILVQDAGSTDGSIEMARGVLGQRNVRVEKDEGQEDAINKAWHRSTGDVLAWLNSDDLLEPEALRVVEESFGRAPNAEWCVGKFKIIDEQGRPIRRLHTAYKHFLLNRYSRRLLFVENMIPQMSVFIKRSLWERVGNLKKGIWAFDYDYWLRLSALAEPLVIGEHLSSFRWHSTSKTGRDVGKLFKEELDVCRDHTSSKILRTLHWAVYQRNRLLYNVARW